MSFCSGEGWGRWLYIQEINDSEEVPIAPMHGRRSLQFEQLRHCHVRLLFSRILTVHYVPVFSMIVVNRSLFMSMGWDDVSELRLSVGLFFIPQETYEYGGPQ